jgi:hypothetical protein
MVSESVGCRWMVRPMSAASGAHFDRQRRLGDQLPGVRTDDAAADDPVRVLVEQDLGQPFVAPEGQRAAACRPREDAFAVVDARRLGLAFGNTSGSV